MPSDQRLVAKVIVCGQNKFIIHKDQLFAHTNQSVTSQGNIVDNWKCVHRRCCIRIWTWDQKFKPETENHLHSSTAAAILNGQDYSVSQELYSVKSNPMETPPNTPPMTSSTTPAPSRGKEIKERPLGSLDSSGSSTSPLPESSWSVLKYKTPTRPSVNTLSTPVTPGDEEVWTPPVLSPPADGRPYAQCIPLHPVARIGPCPEPNTYYHPYFAYQLHNHYLNRMHSFAAQSIAFKNKHYEPVNMRTMDRFKRFESD